MATWIIFMNDDIGGFRTVLDLDRVVAFQITKGPQNLTLHTPATGFSVSQKKNPEAYQIILDYVKQKTGHSLT